MSLVYIRRAYNVPAKRGARVRVDWDSPAPTREGTITGADGARLRIRLDGEKHSRSAHPTWRIEYLMTPNVEFGLEPKRGNDGTSL